MSRLNDSDRGVRKEAMYVLGLTRDPRAFEPLVKLLDSPEHEFRNAAADGLSALGDDRAMKSLIERMTRSKEDDVEWAEAALGWMQNDRVVPALLGLLQQREEQVRQRAAAALAVKVTAIDSNLSGEQRTRLRSAATEDVLSCIRGEVPERLKTLAGGQDTNVAGVAFSALQRLDEIRQQIFATRPASCPAP
jgi:HEAT repeat protein